MTVRFTHCLTWLTLLFACLLLGPARAQVLSGTFAIGGFHALAIHADGSLWATGRNLYGQLGDGTTTNRAGWVQVGTATNWVQVGAGFQHSLALRTDGTLYAWGANNLGQLGLAATAGTTAPTSVPMPVPGTWTQLSTSFNHSLGLRADGSLWAWGSNQYGRRAQARHWPCLTASLRWHYPDQVRRVFLTRACNAQDP